MGILRRLHKPSNTQTGCRAYQSRRISFQRLHLNSQTPCHGASPSHGSHHGHWHTGQPSDSPAAGFHCRTQRTHGMAGVPSNSYMTGRHAGGCRRRGQKIKKPNHANVVVGAGEALHRHHLRRFRFFYFLRLHSTPSGVASRHI